MDNKSQESGHLMLILPERVFYAGLLGRPRERCPGAFHVYVALKGGLWLSTADGFETYGELVAVAPNVRHTIASDYRPRSASSSSRKAFNPVRSMRGKSVCGARSAISSRTVSDLPTISSAAGHAAQT